MWLSFILFSARSTPGNQWYGKHRKVHKITKSMRQNAARKGKQEQQVRETQHGSSHVMPVRPYRTETFWIMHYSGIEVIGDPVPIHG